jgi:AraC-like DNA-binding protein
MLTYRLKTRFPSLRTLGIAVEHFPRYVNREVNLHTLDIVLLSCILRGRGRHIIGDETFAEAGPSVAVTHYGQHHDILTDARGMEVINVYLDLQRFPPPALPRELQMVLPLLLPLHATFAHRLNRIVRLQLEDSRPMAGLLLAIRRELAERQAGYEEAVAMQFKLFLMLCCRHALRRGLVPQPAPGGHRVQHLEDLRLYLDQAYAQPHTLEALARRAGLSRTYLCRAFKAYTGKRPFDYLIERRIQAAMMRLPDREAKVLVIALECGFNDLSYFNRKFKELIGQTPTAYRRERQGAPPA